MSENIQFNRSAIRAGDCVSDGWNLIKPDYWLFFGINAPPRPDQYGGTYGTPV